MNKKDMIFPTFVILLAIGLIINFFTSSTHTFPNYLSLVLAICALVAEVTMLIINYLKSKKQ